MKYNIGQDTLHVPNTNPIGWVRVRIIKNRGLEIATLTLINTNLPISCKTQDKYIAIENLIIQYFYTDIEIKTQFWNNEVQQLYHPFHFFPLFCRQKLREFQNLGMPQG